MNKAAKEFLRRKFQNWYATQVCAQLDGKLEKEAPIECNETAWSKMGD